MPEPTLPGTSTAPPAPTTPVPTPPVVPSVLGGDSPAPTTPELNADGTPKVAAQTPTGDDAPKGAPEKYELKAPEGTTLDPAAMEKYEALFREANLTNEAAQKLVDTYSADQKARDAEAGARIVKQHDEWFTALKADPEIGGANFDKSCALAQSAIARFGSPALKEFMKTSPVGSHPEVVRAFAQIGKAMAEDTIVTGKQSSAEKDTAKQMFPSMK